MNLSGHIALEDSNELKKIIDSLLIQKKVDTAEINRLQDEVNLLRAALYGRTSERVIDDAPEPTLFDGIGEPSSENLPADDEDDDSTTEVKGHTRKKKGRKPIPEHFPRIDQIHDLDESEKICGCGCMKECIGEEVSEQLNIIPAKIEVIRHIRLKYACKACEGVEDDGPTISIARMPDQVIPKCIGTPGLIAHVLIAKFADALPFYRQEKQFLRMGVEISRVTMCNWAKQVALSFEILLLILQQEVLSGPLIQVDETPVQVLNEPNRSNHTKSYMWVFRGGTRAAPVVIFEYHPSREGKIAADFLDGYEGVVQTDGYAGYDFLDPQRKTKHMACWAHVRRKFFKVVKAAGNPKKGKPKNSFTKNAMKLIKRLYDFERQTKIDGLTGDALLAERQEKGKPSWMNSKCYWIKQSSK